MSALVEEMFSTRETPWHGLGRIVAEAPSSKEALKIAGLDWEVKKVPLYTQAHGGYREIEGTFANERSTDKRVLGIVSDKYTIVQNTEAFAFVDNLFELDQNTKYETAGSLRNGRRIWLLTRLDKFKLVGDDTQNYLCFTNTFDGTGAVRAMVTPVRVVCMNTLNLAISQAKRSWSCVHMGNIANKLEEAKQSLQLVNDYVLALQNRGEKLQEVKIDFKEVLNNIIPIYKNDTERIKKRKKDEINTILSLTEREDLKKFGSSSWSLINAVSDYAFHREPKRSSESYKEKVWDKVISGGSLLDVAYDYLEKIT